MKTRTRSSCRCRKDLQSGVPSFQILQSLLSGELLGVLLGLEGRGGFAGRDAEAFTGESALDRRQLALAFPA